MEQTGTIKEDDEVEGNGGMMTEEDDTEEGTDEFDAVGGSDEDEDDFMPDEVEEDEPITANGVANVGGQAVQIILTGVMITPAEVAYVAEASKKTGSKLKAVKGAGKVVNFIVENSGKQ